MKTTAAPAPGSREFRLEGLLHRRGALPRARRHAWLAGFTLLVSACGPGQILDPGPTSGAPDQQGGAGGGGSTPLPPPTSPTYLPARIRRLSNFEYDRTVAALVGTTATPASGFAVDFRQNDFTQNAAQQVDAVYAGQVQSAARDLAKAAVQAIVSGISCAATGGEPCARQIITGFGARAYRRPLTELETAGLLAVFKAGATSAGFNDGIENVITAILQSPNFLFLTELGDGKAQGGVVTMTNHEIASALSYLITGGPPDGPLLDAADAGRLAAPGERATQVRRLLMNQGARPQLARLFKEWLGIDLLENTGKDQKVFPQYDALKAEMIAEADSFVGEVLFNDDGTLPTLLSADYTIAAPELAQFYGIASGGSGGRAPYGSVPRRGLLMQAAFQAAHANDHETHPVKRGNTVLKKVMCVILPLPGELNIKVVPPPPDPSKTTRERFTQHSTDPACAGCHRAIDPIGFLYENIDGMGGLRTTENGKPIVTAAQISAGDLEGLVQDGVELSGRLSASKGVQECFARNLFRFAAAQSGQGYEDLYLQTVWQKMPAATQLDVKEMLVALASSDVFVKRSLPR